MIYLQNFRNYIEKASKTVTTFQNIASSFFDADIPQTIDTLSMHKSFNLEASKPQMLLVQIHAVAVLGPPLNPAVWPLGGKSPDGNDNSTSPLKIGTMPVIA